MKKIKSFNDDNTIPINENGEKQNFIIKQETLILSNIKKMLLLE